MKNNIYIYGSLESPVHSKNLLSILNKKVIVIDTTALQKSRYVVPTMKPLKKYINRFKVNINRGMNVIEALDIIKKDVNIKLFTDFVR